MFKSYNPLNITNNFIDRSINERERLSPMKLQKLMYFLYRDYLKATQTPLFSERFEAWKYGPVLHSVYDEYRKYKDKDISEYYAEPEQLPYKINEDTNFDFRDAINTVWQKYKTYSGIELSKITHREGSAWYKAWTQNKIFLTDEDIINDEVD